MIYQRVFLVAALIFYSLLFSDQRNFIWTYEKKMLAPGESEFEFYLTNEYPHHNIFQNESNTTLKLEYEFEIGMTENMEVAFYSTFLQTPEDGLKFDAYKLRFKYNIFQKQNTWTPLFYSELYGNLDFTKYVLEQKFIFTKHFNKYNLSFNPIVELESEKNNDTWHREIEVELALGLSYMFDKNISMGFDLKSSEYATYFGPVFAHGGEDKFWTFGLMRKIQGENDKSDFIIRSIMGFHV